MITSICQMRLRVGKRQASGQEELRFELGSKAHVLNHSGLTVASSSSDWGLRHRGVKCQIPPCTFPENRKGFAESDEPWSASLGFDALPSSPRLPAVRGLPGPAGIHEEMRDQERQWVLSPRLQAQSLLPVPC
ncbi:hypothetical protein QTO34_017116 [Cnephaeus nilssonii]|uniref:Uncharacterized protein n=1 Tax=Cnephaeus nilssonii TaxID=3371016 RepID=A0AA40LPK9_CNENI|nr:hypothetical protein QTO34_017116 [Eptesicus nilssonii]